MTAQDTSSWVADSAPCTWGRIAATEKVAALKAVDATTTVISTKMRRDTVSSSVGWSGPVVTCHPPKYQIRLVDDPYRIACPDIP